VEQAARRETEERLARLEAEFEELSPGNDRIQRSVRPRIDQEQALGGSPNSQDKCDGCGMRRAMEEATKIRRKGR